MRRTKKDAMETRSSLLDAAEEVFHKKGVSRASLEDIAKAAGASRGAVYWHFQSKTDLFNAMMDRVTLPMESGFETCWVGAKQDEPTCLEQLLEMVNFVFESVEADDATRRVFEIAMFKVEYVGVMDAVRTRHISACESFKKRLQLHLEGVVRQQGLLLHRACIDDMSIALHALIDGLIQNWILTDGAFRLQKTGGNAVRLLLAGLLGSNVQNQRSALSGVQ
jgi:TetR/AcrR family acrAB operon transcriptional repressor